MALTAGAAGCWYLSADVPGQLAHQPAFRVEVADTTGCGDVFHGAYAFGLARGWNVAERMRFAAATAALKAEQTGGQAGIPTFDRVNAFLQELRRRAANFAGCGAAPGGKVKGKAMDTSKIAYELETALAEVPVIDVHTHLVGGRLGARGLHDVLLYHMVVSDLYAAGSGNGARLTQYPAWPTSRRATPAFVRRFRS